MISLRLQLQTFTVAGSCMVLAACATKSARESAAPASVAAIPGENRVEALRSAPVRVSNPVRPVPADPAEPAASTRPPKPPPSPAPIPRPASTPGPTPATGSRTSDFLRSGQVESDAGGILVVKKPSSEGGETPGLFEDAIIQNRVRAALIANGHLAAAESVKVRGGIAEIDLSTTGSPERSAGAVDAALAVSGVSKVRATGSR